MGHRLSGARDAIGYARLVHRRGGKSVLSQLIEMARLRRAPNRIMPAEYYAFGLYDDVQFDGAAKRRFVGQWSKDSVYQVNDPAWRAVGDDKLLAYALFQSFGIPHPEVIAVCHARRTHPRARMLRSADQVAAWLREEASYPIFSKPADGALGSGAASLEAYDKAADALLLGNGHRLPVGRFIAKALSPKHGGMILQKLAKPHPVIADLCGPRIASVRLMMLCDGDSPLLHRAAWRLPTGSNMVDNFQHGSSGNLLASIDPVTGRVEQVISSAQVGTRKVTLHPDTGRPLVGFRIPAWAAMVEQCQEAAAAFPGLRIQAWDAVPSDDGPLFLELNTHADLDVVQLAHGQGIADERWRRLTKM